MELLLIAVLVVAGVGWLTLRRKPPVPEPEPPTGPEADIKVENLSIEPSEVGVGGSVRISALAKNYGGRAGSYTIRLGGDFMAEQTVSLQPGESKTVSFMVTATAVKTYSVSVDGLSGSFKATEAPVADIRVSNLAIAPKEATVGGKVSISVTATNHGNAAGSRKVLLTVS